MTSTSLSILAQEDSKIKKQSLLCRLLEGVKSCQSRYGLRTELATEHEESVRNLCSAFEDIFLFGLKKNNAQGKGLWHMTESLVKIHFLLLNSYRNSTH